MIICEYCSAKNKSDDLECRKCGAPLKIDNRGEVPMEWLKYPATSSSCYTSSIVANIDEAPYWSKITPWRAD